MKLENARDEFSSDYLCTNNENDEANSKYLNLNFYFHPYFSNTEVYIYNERNDKF